MGGFWKLLPKMDNLMSENPKKGWFGDLFVFVKNFSKTSNFYQENREITIESDP